MNIEQAKAWRRSLKEGNGVVVVEKNRSMKIATVERVTPTQVIIMGQWGNLRRFSKERGTEVGAHYGPTIQPITDDARARIKAADNRSEFSSLCYRPDRLKDDEIAVMLEALNALRASKEDNASPI